jgi:hypothetical protein
MIWVRIRKPLLICKLLPDASSVRWPRDMASPPPWPEEPLLNRVISQANGLFIFVKTLALALQKCGDPEETLKETLEGSAGSGLEPLYNLYSSIVKAHSNTTGFWRVIVVITTAQHRSLCKEPIAELAGVKPYLVEKLVDDLSSLLYRDQGAIGGIRVRHLSIYEFFVSDRCDYRANLQAAHMEQGIACLKTMIGQLRFNICNLEDSRLANADVKDLQSRIEQNISDPLQYSVSIGQIISAFRPVTVMTIRACWEA